MVDIANLFFQGDNLKRTICALCNGRDQLCVDPISETLIVMHTAHIQVMVTESGVALFRDHPMMIIPFLTMTMDQLKLLAGIVMEFISSRENVGVTTAPQAHMGGGRIIFPCTTGQKVPPLPFLTLVKAFVDLVCESPGYDLWSRRAICSVVLQRMAASVGVSPDAMREASAYVSQAFPEA